MAVVSETPNRRIRCHRVGGVPGLVHDPVFAQPGRGDLDRSEAVPEEGVADRHDVRRGLLGDQQVRVRGA
jgi:hypothetical protein